MIRLSSQITVTKSYSGKSKFPFWSELKAGDSIHFFIDLRPIGGGRRKYATTVKLTKFSDGTPSLFSCSIDECCNYLSKIEYI